MASELGPSEAVAVPGLTRVLVVDDDFDSAEVLGLVLGDAGYDVRVEMTARKAIDAASEFTPHFAIVDIGLPETSGYELVAILRSIPHLNECRYIALSGHATESMSKQSLVVGFERHLNKPITIERVLAALEAPRASVASRTTRGER